ncbi:MAG: adenylate/guanylate cyclase domain-containing protein [Actinomycetia bacterium]|nr:adenylate/guanylate cyclase domain-containing protein [Actinomycetes bacterium]MCP4224023.1 adenylate/guanylate cyclase domain-containing protein [Actinomycetes bacterium]MCP5033429.1 adenylate/guanylate cyclase domain-containing protein [Actinomycetes bacterium]
MNSDGSDCVGAVLFTDLVGFTEYTDSVGDEAALQVLDSQTAMALSLVDDREHARIVKELGDGLMLWFDTAADGLETAAELLDDIDIAHRAGEFPLAVRMGIHYGPVIARGDDVVGQTVNIAARLADIAGPGELLVSEHLIDTLSNLDSLTLRAVGPVTVKGIRAPIWVHRLQP